ncbi:tRNA lysidine(34) synthetase TilS [Geoalkalibacter sp.]|uniref:tRNA lysidine(34) synthetase TilS n=1 Tax=Geoalkalibacter sp. TaxID=3041440 RepID=UPI00272E2CBF|nr:tRNA lysidine(34) synthetase TilS [Geoalkalibacter sp.]
MLDKVREYIHRHRLMVAGDRVLVAVSGGGDSMALLHLLWSLREDFGVILRAAHLDHALRPQSAAEADFVRSFCEHLAVPLHVARIAVPDHLERGCGGVEQVAREVRHRFLAQAAMEADCNLIALGHHRGDQAETLLHRLVRGAGPTGLAGMRPRNGRLIRPLLGVARGEILAYLQERGIGWVEDPSNQDLGLTRNRLRHLVLPLLETFNPRVEEGLARLAERFAREEDYWRLQVEPLVESFGEVRLPLAETAALHPALRDRVLRQAMLRARGDLRGIEDKHVAAAAHLLEKSGRGRKDFHLPGLWLVAERGWLRLLPELPEVPPAFCLDIPAPGVYRLPDGRCLRLSLEDRARGESPRAVEYAAEALGFPLRARSWRAGDRMRLEGMTGRKKIKDLFAEARLSRDERSRAPLLLHGEEILWLAGVRRCAGLRPLAGGGKILRVVLDDAKMETLRL